MWWLVIFILFFIFFFFFLQPKLRQTPNRTIMYSIHLSVLSQIEDSLCNCLNRGVHTHCRHTGELESNDFKKGNNKEKEMKWIERKCCHVSYQYADIQRQTDRKTMHFFMYIHLHQRFECATMEECIRIILQRNIDSFLPFFFFFKH